MIESTALLTDHARLVGQLELGLRRQVDERLEVRALGHAGAQYRA